MHLHLKLPGHLPRRTRPPSPVLFPQILTHQQPFHHPSLLLLCGRLFSGAYLCYPMHNSFGVAAFSLPPLVRESASFLLFDFAASREAVPRASFMFPHSTDISSKRRIFVHVWECVDCSVFFLCVSVFMNLLEGG